MSKQKKKANTINETFRTGMNEWSPQDYYYRVTAANSPPHIQVPCHSWQDNWDSEKLTSFKTMNNCRMRERHKTPDTGNNFLSEDAKIPLSSSKKKKIGASDPRFKKIINTESRNAAKSESGKLEPNIKMHSPSYQENRDRLLNEEVISFLRTPNNCSMFMTPNMKCLMNQEEQEASSEVTKDPGFQMPDKYFVNNNAKEFSYNDIQTDIKEDSLDAVGKSKRSYKTDLKRSASDCAVQMKTILRANESGENILAYPSASEISNADNRMKRQKTLPEKRRSVVTVIGQTQTKPFSQILSEIHQRRKLAKELDKHALCEALMSSMENHSEFKNVVTKVDLVLPDGKIIYSAEKVYTQKDNRLEDSLYSQNSVEILDSDSKRKRCDMIPEKDSSTSRLGRKRLKRVSKKSISTINEKFKLKDSLRNIYKDVSPNVLWLLLAILCFGLCFSVFLYTFRTPQTYYILEFFKPKTAAWYEKLLF